MKRFAIIVAGGSGTRMGSEIPKQFLLLNSKPILMHTIEKFYNSNSQIILVLNLDYHDYWIKLCKEHNFTIPHQLVKGGRNRFDSVKNGLGFITEDSLVAIHDAVRPLIKTNTIHHAFEIAEEKGNAILAVPSKDSLRRMVDGNNYSLTRSEYYLIQTPQIFKSSTLKKAYDVEFRNEFTDDASVVERIGEKINLVEGDYSNIKITVKEDLKIAEVLLSEEEEKKIEKGK